MTPANVRAFRAITGQGTLTLACAGEDGSPTTMDLVTKALHHIGIARILFRYPQAGEVLAAYVDAQSAGRSGTATPGAGSPLVEAARAAAAAGGMSVGTLVSLLVRELPDLVTELLVSSIVVNPGESVDDLIHLVQSQDIDVFAGALLSFIRTNFARGTAPFLAAARIVGVQVRAKSAAAPAPAPAAAADPASGNPSTSAPSASDAPAAEATGSTA